MRMTEISGLRLTIDQISQLSGVPKSTLRYWEKSFTEFLKPGRTTSNRREYTMEDLEVIQAIRHLLKQEHLTAQGVRMKLREILAPERPAQEFRKMAARPNPSLLHHPPDQPRASKA